MTEALDECQHESCIKPFNGKSIRTYVCAHHCGKRLCIKHLNEHEQLIEEQAESKTYLKQSCDNYSKVVNKDTIEKQIQLLQLKLQLYCDLYGVTEKLLLFSDCNSSIKTNQNMQLVIEMLKKYILLEKQSKPIAYEIDPKNESYTEDEAANESCIGLGEIYSRDKHIISRILAELQDGNSTVATANEGETSQTMGFDPIHTKMASSSSEIRNSVILQDHEDDRVKILKPKNMFDENIIDELLNDKKEKDQELATSNTTSIHCMTRVESDLTDASHESIIQNKCLDTSKEILSDSGPKQAAIKKSDGDSSFDDVFSKSRSTTPEFERLSSEDSCY